ncbi:hypothetical protein CP49_21550 [Bradyrhizobium valentinum]|uniref:Secreted protein n=1 Tax=Bradyrhizobium valentinum TaxID=1518501 RepID=A0A0R3LGK5_9BRAD|nr:hypothetical protein CP49_21550 [Bradyrhizobium valentinum]
MIRMLIVGFVFAVARLVGAGRNCEDETSAGCVIVVAAFESPAVIAGLDDVTVMGQASSSASA